MHRSGPDDSLEGKSDSSKSQVVMALINTNAQRMTEPLSLRIVEKLKIKDFIPSVKLEAPVLFGQNIWVPMMRAPIGKSSEFVAKMRLFYSLPEIRQLLLLNPTISMNDLFMKDQFQEQLDYLYGKLGDDVQRRHLVDLVGVRGRAIDGSNREVIIWSCEIPNTLTPFLGFTAARASFGMGTIISLPKYLLFSRPIANNENQFQLLDILSNVTSYPYMPAVGISKDGSRIVFTQRYRSPSSLLYDITSRLQSVSDPSLAVKPL